MLKKIALCLMTTILISALLSCGGTTSNNTSRTGDIIIPPDSASNNILSSNQRNISNASNLYQQNIVNKLYDQIGKSTKLLDFDVDESRIFSLRSKGVISNGINFGDTIDVSGIEDGNLLYTITYKDMGECTAVAEYNGMVYVYCNNTGNIFVFSVDGNFIKIIESKLSGLKVDKMQVDSDRIFLLVAGTNSQEEYIYLIYMNGSDPYKIDKSMLVSSMNYSGEQKDTSNAYIQDFCIKDEKSIIIKMCPERICLYDFVDHAVKKVSYMPDSAGFIDFSSDVFFYASGMDMGIFNNNVVNSSNEGSQDYVGRLLMNDKFTWTIDPSSLSDFQLGDILIPYSSKGSQHVKIRQNNRYVFLLDYASAGWFADYESLLYRVVK
jgi:hypothetical protein